MDTKELSKSATFRYGVEGLRRRAAAKAKMYAAILDPNEAAMELPLNKDRKGHDAPAMQAVEILLHEDSIIDCLAHLLEVTSDFDDWSLIRMVAMIGNEAGIAPPDVTKTTIYDSCRWAYIRGKDTPKEEKFDEYWFYRATAFMRLRANSDNLFAALRTAPREEQMAFLAMVRDAMK